MSQKTTSEAFTLPWGDLVQPLLRAIFAALSDLCNESFNQAKTDHGAINAHFKVLHRHPFQKDQHLVAAPQSEHSLRTRKGSVEVPTRISNLILNAFQKTDLEFQRAPGKFLPSPLQILLDFLTIPSEPASRAYAWATLRTLIFQEMGLWPDGNEVPPGFETFTFTDVRDALESIEREFTKRNNIDIKKPTKVLVGHFLAMKGLMKLRFGSLRDGTQRDPTGLRLQYCNNALLTPNDGYEFRVSELVERLPESAELINEIWGVPIPIRGADTVFFGGLRFSSKGGLVAVLSGPPGSGKTSFAIGLASVLAPLGARTVYITTEEDPADLRLKLATLTPKYHRNISVRSSSDITFKPIKLEAQQLGNATDRLETLREILQEIKNAESRNSDDVVDEPSAKHPTGLPLPCRLIVVFDGMKAYLPAIGSTGVGHENDYSLEQFVEDCHKLGALVILASAAEVKALMSLEYLVDVFITFEYRHSESPEEKPVRVMILHKTRHQISRPGAHIFHLSGADGIRLAPQLPSQLDKRSLLKIGVFHPNLFADILNRVFRFEDLVKVGPDSISSSLQVRVVTPPDDLNIYNRSHILVHGWGSTGKAGFGMKILAAPILEDRSTRRIVRKGRDHRILAVSFLYPREYYEELLNRLNKLFILEYRQTQELLVPPSELDVLHLYAGYLNPEDLFNSICRKLDEADWNGKPFTGILLDGLHNVFLQFPRIERNPMIWPMLYDMFRRRDVTVVTTDTTIGLDYDSKGIRGDMDLEIRQAKPLLHAIVQAADFFFELSYAPGKDTDQTSSKDGTDARWVPIPIVVRSAVGQERPRRDLFWHREKLVVFEQRTQGKLI